jgi:hypothetical protein
MVTPPSSGSSTEATAPTNACSSSSQSQWGSSSEKLDGSAENPEVGFEISLEVGSDACSRDSSEVSVEVNSEVSVEVSVEVGFAAIFAVSFAVSITAVMRQPG